MRIDLTVMDSEKVSEKTPVRAKVTGFIGTVGQRRTRTIQVRVRVETVELTIQVNPSPRGKNSDGGIRLYRVEREKFWARRLFLVF
jgi:hypothetical protein